LVDVKKEAEKLKFEKNVMLLRLKIFNDYNTQEVGDLINNQDYKKD